MKPPEEIKVEGGLLVKICATCLSDRYIYELRPNPPMPGLIPGMWVEHNGNRYLHLMCESNGSAKVFLPHENKEYWIRLTVITAVYDRNEQEIWRK